MTKEEFLKMVDVVLDQIFKEKNKSLSRVEYYKSVNPNGTEFATANYQYLVACKKLDLFRSLIGLPAYARIQAMSDGEIEEYKKDKINDIKLDGITIAAEIEKLKKDIQALKDQHEELITHFVELEMEKRNSAINEGKKIQFDIQSKEFKLNELELKLTKLKSQQEEISQMSSDDVKKQLISKIANGYQLDSIISNSSEISSSRALMAAVGKEPEKAMKMAQLMTNLVYTEKKSKDIFEYLDLGYDLPSRFRHLIESDYVYNRGNIANTSRFFEIYQSFMEQFEKESEAFSNQFTKEKISGLVGKEYNYLSETVDFEFLKLHSDKLSPGQLEELQADVLKRDKLSKKIIKTREVKRDIEDLNRKISMVQKSIYQKIIDWYRAYNVSDILRVDSYLFLNDSDKVMKQLAEFPQQIQKSRDALLAFKTRLENVQTNLDYRRKQHTEQVNEIKQQIRAMGGKDFVEADIPFAHERTDDNLSSIASATAFMERKPFIGQVLDEAQNQANMWQPKPNPISQENVEEENIGGKTI